MLSDAVSTLRFVGGAGTVTGSRFLFDTPEARVLVDCGLFQGRKDLRLRNWDPFEVDPASIDALVLTHAHLDHCGYVPRLVRDGFAGPVFATDPTIALARIVLTDSGRLQEEDAGRANRRGYTRHSPAAPLYTEAQAEAALRRFRPMSLVEQTEIAAGVVVKPTWAGHILGSASLALRVEDDPPFTVLFSGDLGRPNHPILRPPAPRPEVDVVVLESTYGDVAHDDEGAMEAFASAISRTAERRGTVVIPAYAVDRTEVILVHLHRLLRQGRVPELPVYVDSPMALAALRLYRAAVRFGAPDVRDDAGLVDDALNAPNLVEARSVEESKQIDHDTRPKIVVSASGMATGGRVVHHLQRYLPDRRSTVVLVGFQAPGTRGHALEQGARELRMFGTLVPVRAEIVTAPAFSVHADQDELIDWLTAAPPPAMTCLVHGEPDAADALRRRLLARRGWPAVVAMDGGRVEVPPR